MQPYYYTLYGVFNIFLRHDFSENYSYTIHYKVPSQSGDGQLADFAPCSDRPDQNRVSHGFPVVIHRVRVSVPSAWEKSKEVCHENKIAIRYIPGAQGALSPRSVSRTLRIPRKTCRAGNLNFPP